MPELVTLRINVGDYDRTEAWRLTAWCQKQGADEWTLAAMTVASPDAFIRPTELWRLNSELLTIWPEFFPDGLFAYRIENDGWFEDPTFYRPSELMLGVVSHEHKGILRVSE